MIELRVASHPYKVRYTETVSALVRPKIDTFHPADFDVSMLYRLGWSFTPPVFPAEHLSGLSCKWARKRFPSPLAVLGESNHTITARSFYFINLQFVLRPEKSSLDRACFLT